MFRPPAIVCLCYLGACGLSLSMPQLQERHHIESGNTGGVMSPPYSPRVSYRLSWRIAKWHAIGDKTKGKLPLGPLEVPQHDPVAITVLDLDTGKVLKALPNAKEEDSVVIPWAGRHAVIVGNGRNSGQWDLWYTEDIRALEDFANKRAPATGPDQHTLAATARRTLEAQQKNLNPESASWAQDKAEIARKQKLVELAEHKATTAAEFTKLLDQLVPGLSLAEQPDSSHPGPDPSPESHPYLPQPPAPAPTAAPTPPTPVATPEPKPSSDPDLPPGMERVKRGK